MDVDEVRLATRQNINLRKGYSAMSGKIDTLEVDVSEGGEVGWPSRISTRLDIAVVVSMRPSES